MPKLSVIIITLNEAPHIAAAIDSAAWADEILVVDAGSTDGTADIARARGAIVLNREWNGYVDQKNFAAGRAAHDWILSLDADERIPPGLADEMRSVLAVEPPMPAYRMPRVTHHLGRWIRTTDFYPDYQTRLYDRRRARWQGRYVHESVRADGPIGQLRHELEHYSYSNLRDQLDRINRYSTLSARQMFEDGRRAHAFDLIVHPPAAFLRNYLLRRGIMDGAPGFIISAANVYSVFLKFAKLWELQRAGTTPAPPGAFGTGPGELREEKETLVIDTPTIVRTEEQPTAVIRLTVPRSEIQQVMGPAINEVMTGLAAQGVAPAGPVFSRHFRMDPAIFDFEVGVPVAGPISPTGRVQAGLLPATTVARTVYQGPYEGLGAAWGEFDKWIASQGHTPDAGLWERYLAGPESGADPAMWRTELNHPLVK